MEITFNIPVQRIHEVYKHLSKLQKRAQKNGQSSFSFAFDDEVKYRSFEAQSQEGEYLKVCYDYRILRVNQDITVHEGWVPIVKLDIAEKQIRSYAVYNKEIESLGDSLWSKRCDHCGHSKIVHTAFVMQNGDKFMKVGKGCMKELAPASAAQIGREFDIYALWNDYLTMMAAPEEGEFGGGLGDRGFGNGITVDAVYDKSVLILAMRAALEKSDGKWVTSEYYQDRSDSRYGQVRNKGHRTFDFIQGFLDKDRHCLLPDQKFIDSVNADVNMCLEKYSDLLGDKLEEVKSFADSERARVIDIFLVKTAQGIIERERKRDEMRVSEYQGEVGAKVPLTLEFVSERHGEGQFGGWTLTIFKDQSGNMFKKFGAVPDRFKIDDGVYQFTAPIKAHETYQEIKYTVLGGPLSKFKK